jgi:hypothetical protein
MHTHLHGALASIQDRVSEGTRDIVEDQYLVWRGLS